MVKYKMKKGKISANRGGKKMGTVLCLPKNRTGYFSLKEKPHSNEKHIYSEKEVRKIYELENRRSGADEFSYLWDDRKDK